MSDEQNPEVPVSQEVQQQGPVTQIVVQQQPQPHPQDPYVQPQGIAPFPAPPGSQPQLQAPYVQSQGIAPFPVPPGSQPQTVDAPQPQPIQWMPPPTGLANCPPGLEYLTQIDQILVHQQVELWEVVTAYQTANRYIVKNTLGQQIYFAAEDSTPFCRQCCGINRPFTLSILDNAHNEVIHMTREFSCSGPCFCCWFKQRMEVQSPPGTVVGYITQNCTCWDPKFFILDAEDREILTITGSMASLCCKPYGDIVFEVSTMDGLNVGNVTKQFSGLAKELFTTADNFGITFPMDLDVRMKAVVLGACFLIDFIFFERRQQQNNRRRHHHGAALALHQGGHHGHHRPHHGHHGGHRRH
ncbi:Phospholipid scramblase 2-like [Oopsacas minuta]|uniref:Phospholipid scramblase n=1 Tax=Oopsacas minuta TaxID=111878 RepID=A0AAV7JLA7_9METZ|nr:Phospholipid scramblase 2-like [Oopsacas minuta]